MSGVRADVKLVELGLAKSRTQAADLIKAGHVLYQGIPLKKASQLVSEDDFQITKERIYVGRGAHKIESALKYFPVDFKSKTILDVGASTGGFTQYALELGAAHVFAVDVGSDQLDPILIADERVSNLEKTDIRSLESLDSPVDVVVVDVSFISLTHIFDSLVRLAPKAQMIILVKPQFEVGQMGLGKGGIVKEREIRHQVLRELALRAKDFGLAVKGVCACGVVGKSGNQEYFFWCSTLAGEEVDGIEEVIKELV